MSIRVLLVDDEQSFAEILSERLEIRDFSVVTVSSGEEAVSLIQSKEFDVILLDVLMPGKSGIDTLKEMMKVEPLSHIIMLTGHARMETAMEGMKLGAYDYLIKPPKIEALVEKIKLAYDHKTTQKAKQQKKTIPAGSKRQRWGKWIPLTASLFQKERHTPSRSSDGDEIKKTKDEY